MPATPSNASAYWLEHDPLDAAHIRSLARTADAWQPLEVWRSLTSTLDRLRALRAAGAGPGAVVIAEEQTAGRGRRGTVWQSPAGLGLWLGALIDIAGVAPGVATLTTAVAAQRAIRAAAGGDTTLKWPNDVEIGGRKVCGIVFEVVGRGPAALGIGINVHHAAADFPPAIAARAISLDQATGVRAADRSSPSVGRRPVERDRLAARLLDELASNQDDWRQGRGAELLDAWRRAASHLGRRVELSLPGGVLAGVAADVAADGALLIDLADGERRRVLAGSLRVIDG
jgi:BirA family biotin operon repressor/biotin-[acetyl-CoA-carboxylase] ligase